MANAMNDAGLRNFCRAQVDWINHDIRALLVDTANYTFSQAHEFLTSVPAAARGANIALTGKTVAGAGIMDAADPTFAQVQNVSYEAIIIYKHTGTDSTSILLAYIDTAPGLPVQTSGGTVQVTLNAGGLLQI